MSVEKSHINGKLLETGGGKKENMPHIIVRLHIRQKPSLYTATVELVLFGCYSTF